MSAQDLVAGPKSGRRIRGGTALAAYGRQISIICEQRASPEPFYAPPDVDYVLALIRRSSSYTRHLDKKPPAGQAATGKQHTGPCGESSSLLFPAGYLILFCMAIFTWLVRGRWSNALSIIFLVRYKKKVLVVGKFLPARLFGHRTLRNSRFACFYLMYSRFGSAGK